MENQRRGCPDVSEVKGNSGGCHEGSSSKGSERDLSVTSFILTKFPV